MLYTLYLRISPTGLYYVGCTTKSVEARAGVDGVGYRESRMWSDIQKYGWSSFQTEILDVTEDAELAAQLEDFYMDLFDSRNPLHGYNKDRSGGARTTESIEKQSQTMHKNLTDPNSYFQSSERRLKQSAALKISHNRPEIKAKLSDAAHAYWTEENRANRSELMKRVMSRPEIKTKIQARSADPSYRQKLSEAIRESINEETRQLRSNQLKEQWENPEFREKRIEALRKAQNRPEVRQKRSETLRARLNSPEEKAKRSRVQQEVHSRPEVLEKMSKARKGKRWMYRQNGTSLERRCVDPADIEKYQNQGYRLGLGPRNK